mgnify:FL=1
MAAIPVLVYLVTLLPAIFMGDGTKSVAITAGVRAVMLAIILPVVDGLLVKMDLLNPHADTTNDV